VENAETQIDISGLLPGFYFVKISGEAGNSVGKFVKK
jgi:hypothetical protein